jgi:hypothetical protein
MRTVVTFLLVALPFVAQAQSGTISPNMSRAQVVAALGEPATMRAASEFTYLFYRNSCGKACGMNDLVVLRRDSVVDAIFRSPSRRYTGTSSSPAPISRNEATALAPTKGAPLQTEAPAPRMKPGAPNDTRPSIPAGEPAVRKAPAPATTPATRPSTP